MGYKYIGDSILGVSLTIETPKPLDTRTVVNNLTELYSIPEKYAYQGMTVANIDNGNIYMLLDKSKITEKEGWKASYESIQILTCSLEEYDTLVANTTEDFRPIDPEKDYLHAETYYYIYEDDLGLYYLSSAWGKLIEELLSKKASSDAVISLLLKVNADIANLENNYTKTVDLEKNYALLASFDLSDPTSFLSITLGKYYTKIEVDDIFVTKESLRGEGMEGDDFVFVTKKQYTEDQKSIQEELDKTLKVDGEGSLDSITVGQIKSPSEEGKEQLVIDVKPEGLFSGLDKIATLSEVPNLITLTEDEYKALVESGKVENDTYYYVYNTDGIDSVYVTKEYLESTYSTTHLYLSWVSTNYYSKTLTDLLFTTLEKLKEYYNKTLIDTLFLTKTDAATTYATKQNVADLSDKIALDYVTKESLRGEGSEPEGDDFIFVTLKKYSLDIASNAEEFKTKLLTSTTTSTSEVIILKIEEKQVELVADGREYRTSETLPIITSLVIITSENNKALANNKAIALEEDVPKTACLPLSEYEDLVNNNLTKEDTYYFTYGEKDLLDTGYVRSEYLNEKYYTKAEVELLIQDAIAPLLEKINAFEQGSGSASVDKNKELLMFN